MNQVIFSVGEKVSTELVPLIVNFSDVLQFGEGINGAGITVSVYSGTDPSPINLLSGPATYDTSGNVTQNVQGGIPGTIYTIAFTVTGTNSHNYVKVGQLAVIAPNPFVTG